jgi:predicted metal-binding membrane protein
MADESRGPLEGCVQPLQATVSDGDEPSAAGDGSRLTATLIAQNLRDSGVGCEIVHPVPTDAAVRRRDRAVIVLAIALVTALVWSYLFWLSADMEMGGMDMTGLRMIPSGMGLMMPTDMPWRAMEFGFVFAMWTVMMVGMMTPSAAPMFLMYARVGRQTEAQGRLLSATVWFAIGYFLVWIAFALFATSVQWALERTALLDFTMATTDNVLGGLVFVAAGLYQWTRLNDLCLAECQRPFEFVMRHGGYRRDAPGCVVLGFRHGALLCGLLLGIDGAVARRRRHERALDCPPRAARLFGAGHVHGPPDRASRWYRSRRGRRLAIFNGNVLTARAAAGRA